MDPQALDILIIEDNPADARLIREYFSSADFGSFRLSLADSIAAGLDHLDREHCNVVLLDLSLPDSQGLETLHRLHAHSPHLPIIVLTGLDDDELAFTAMRHGAQDYLLKGEFDLQLLTRAIRYTIERKRAEAEIKQLAYYDSLTGLPNRSLLLDRLGQALGQATRDQRHVGLLFIDLDRFKRINDSLGHNFGDRLLITVAKRLQECVRSIDTLARLGGDEFVVVLTSVAHQEDIARIAQKILDTLSRPVCLGQHDVFTSASIGVSVFPDDGEEIDALLKNADIAMYQAKEQGRNNYQFYCHDMNVRAMHRHLLETSLRHALARDELYLCYQPQFSIKSRELIGVEALLRWKHPLQGRIMPDTFIPIAEETGLIVPIGEWVLRTACLQNKAWQDAGFAPFRMAVNISGRQFKQPDFITLVERILSETGLAPRYLELELTESIVMENAQQNIDKLQALKQMGVKLAIDDFGTGYSSLSYLKNFPIERLKIDRSFVSEINSNQDDAVIAEAIIAMAHSLRLSVIAEGVENEDQLAFLAHHCCDEMQGFLLSQPLTTVDMQAFLQDGIDSKPR